MKIKCITVGLLNTNCYLVEDDVENNGFSAVIDPGGDPSFIKKSIEQTLPQPLTHIILTHGHFDHVGALNDIHKLYPNAKIAISEKTKISTSSVKQQARYLLGEYYLGTCYDSQEFEIPQPNLLLKDGDNIGPFKVLYTPGHTMDSICLYSEEHSVLLSGDTLFYESYGRTDVGGSLKDMRVSLKKILALPSKVIVLPGHGQSTTIGDEKNQLFNI